MELQKTGQNLLYPQVPDNKKRVSNKPDTQTSLTTKDQISIGTSSEKLKVISPDSATGKAGKTSSIFKSLVQPKPSVKRARNEAPVVIVHGTLRDKESIRDYLDVALNSGHPADLSTYLTIKEGEEIEKSGQAVSQRINDSRISLTRENVSDVKSFKGDTEKIKNYFMIDDNLYGKTEPGVNQVARLIPGVTEKMEKILDQDKKELLDSFSSRTKKVEQELAVQVQKTDFASDMEPVKRGQVCQKVAAEIMDTIAPKAILVGHSMGGFVNHIVALNPRENANTKNPFTYDGGNGISTVMHLSSPVGKGLTVPLPRGLSNFAYDMAEKHYFKPMEGTPGMQMAMMNPFFSMWYAAGKEMAKATYKATTEMSSAATNPMVHMMKPGYEQICEGSSFCKTYLDSKQIPKGITFITVTSQHDGVSEQDRSMVDDSQPNVHNLDGEVDITPEDMKEFTNTESRVTHFKMSTYPAEHWKEFQNEVIRNPKELPRLLDRRNYDGMRWNALKVLNDTATQNPGLFRDSNFTRAMGSIREVASERLPFKDSPSYQAKKLLETLEGNIPASPQEPASPDVWILSAPVNPHMLM